ncbi:hypothetical protein [Flavobacterium sp.]|uniref:hypothetical protein n=1 Tax=Flavobacterium sp. TaxID=239 RepID=UPI002621957B|nr:hypothetical protein [Flavobacterium sp.]
MKYTIINGQIEGDFITYYDNLNNTIYTTAQFKKNEQNGTSKEYCSCGRVTKISEFINDRKVSDSIVFHKH